MATLDTLVVELILNSSTFAAQSKGVEKALNGIKTAAQATGLVVAAMFVKSGISQFVSQAQELSNLSRAVRENAEDLQAWGEAVKREGGTAEGFNSTVKKLSDDLMSIPLTGGNSPLLGGLVRLGVQFRNLDGSIRKPLDLLKDLSARFQGMSGAQSLAIGKKLGLDEATIRLLQKGRKGLDELLVKYKEFGVMSNQDIKTGERLKKMFLDYQQIITALGLRFIRFFLPAAEKVTQWLTTAARWVQQNSRIVEAAILAIAAAITASLAPALSKLAFNPVLLGLAAIAAMATLVIEDFMAWKQGADSAFGPVYEWIQRLFDESSDLMIALKQIGDWFANSEVFQIFGKAASEAFDDIKNGVQWLWDFITGFIDRMYDFAGKVGEWFAWLNFKSDAGETKGAYQAMLSGTLKSKLKPLANVNDHAPAIMAGRTQNNQNYDNSRKTNITINEMNVSSNQSTVSALTKNALQQTPLVRTALQDDKFTG